MKNIIFSGFLGAMILIFISCQAVFTYSPLESFQRDPSTLSPEQRIAFAESALASGDVEVMAAAYEAIAGSDNPETNLLAADLAIGASGLTDAITSLVSQSEEADFEDLFDSIDTDMLDNAVTEFSNAEDGETDISGDQYINAAAALVLSIGGDEGFDNITWPETIPEEKPEEDPPGIATAAYWASQGDFNIEDFF